MSNTIAVWGMAFFLCLAIPGAAFAAGDSGAASEEAETGEDGEKLAPGPTVVEVPVLLLPISTPDRRLRQYAYISIQLEIPRPNDRWSVEEKIPFIKDRFIRVLHSTTNVSSDNPNQIDRTALKARLLKSVHDLFGDDRVGSIIIKELAVPGAPRA